MDSKLNQSSMRIILAVVLIAVGVMSLLGANLLWPFFIIVPGIILLGMATMGRSAAAVFSIPGMMIAGTGLLLFVQNLTDYWASWSYAWTLYGVFLGLGFMLMARMIDAPSLGDVGRGFVRFSMIAFLGFSFLMEIVFNVGGGPGLWHIALLAIGAYLLWEVFSGSDGFLLPKKKNDFKLKRGEKLFTGPIVYGSRSSTRLEEQDRVETSENRL